MKSADEIKKGLECCIKSPFRCKDDCPYKEGCNGEQIMVDALTLIQQLEAGLMNATGCRECKHFNNDAGQVPDICMRCRNYSNWEWRGVQKED